MSATPVLGDLIPFSALPGHCMDKYICRQNAMHIKNKVRKEELNNNSKLVYVLEEIKYQLLDIRYMHLPYYKLCPDEFICLRKDLEFNQLTYFYELLSY